MEVDHYAYEVNAVHGTSNYETYKRKSQFSESCKCSQTSPGPSVHHHAHEDQGGEEEGGAEQDEAPHQRSGPCEGTVEKSYRHRHGGADLVREGFKVEKKFGEFRTMV